MKLVNYKRWHNWFDCVIHGTIYVTNSEWSDIIHYISDNRKQLDPYGGNSGYQMFLADTKRVVHTKTHDFYNIRVTATGMLRKKYPFQMANYKRGNYQIAVSREV